MGLPSKDTLPGEAGGPGQEPVGFGVPREGCVGPAGQTAAPEVVAGPGILWGQNPHCAQGPAPPLHAACSKAAAQSPPANTKVSRALGTEMPLFLH